MKDDFFNEGKRRKGISVTAFIIVIILIAVLSSSVTYFFMPTVTVDKGGNVLDLNTPTPLITPVPDNDGQNSDYITTPFTKVYEDNCETVVVLETYVTYNGQEKLYAQSSGFVISADGYILTNSHCIISAEKVKVTTFEGKSYEAEIIGYDERTEVGVVKINTKDKLSVAVLGDSDSVKIGAYAIAIGNPVGFEHSMTVGIVSGLERTVSSNNYKYKMIQIDTAINSGNSGGPLFDIEGKVIGITTMKSASSGFDSAIVEGVGFAIPINVAKDISSQLIKDGKVTRAALNATVGNNVEGNSYNGAYVAELTAGGAAEKAGIKVNDIIIAINDVKVKEVSDLIEQLDYCKPGDSVVLTVLRDKEEIKINVVLGTS